MVRACVPEADDELIARIRRTADGVPFLVEEILASPGVPDSLADTVRARTSAVSDDERRVLEVAAVLGRHFDWRLLAEAAGVDAAVVARGLERGVSLLLLAVDGDTFRFRHALTREALVQGLLPPRRAEIAAHVLAVIEHTHPGLPGGWHDIAADLAAQAGDRARAGALLTASGQVSLARGGLATAADTLRRAVDLLDPGQDRAAAASALVEALALAGRGDEATAAGERLIAQLTEQRAAPAAIAEIHVTVAHAMVAAARWPTATSQLDAAGHLMKADPHDALAARISVLRAEVDLAADDIDRAREHAQSVLANEAASPDLRCHALELLGRSHRTRDLQAAREMFELALATAEAAHLPVARLRALHELGTIEMFDHAGTARLTEARRMADELGALSTGAILDMHLAAAFIFRFQLDDASRHAKAAVAMSERLALDRLLAIALIFMAQISALRRDAGEMERLFARAMAAGDDPFIEGSGWCGGRAMLALLDGDITAAFQAFAHGASLLRQLPNSGPASYRGLWLLLLAARADPRAPAEIEAARRLGMSVNRGNRGYLQYAEAVLAGRRGETARAIELAQRAEADLVHYPVWADLGKLYAAEAALADGWGEPMRWLTAAGESFDAHGLDVPAGRCRELLGAPRAGGWSRAGITAREADVLRLVADGLSNKEIAARLVLSPRTVEKHVESMLRKTGMRSRTQLVAVAGGSG